MNRLTIALAGLLAIVIPAQGQDILELDLLVNNQIRKVVIQLNDAAAPQTCENFRSLAQSGFYKGLAVHRSIPRYVVQMGDPFTKDVSKKALWGTGGPGHTIPAEIGLPHERGAVAMARLPDSRNRARASNGSQFYIALDDLDHLNGQYTVFGKVIRGIEHLDYISERTVDTNDVPIQRIEVAALSAPSAKPSGANVLAPVAAAAAGATGAVRNAGSSVAEVATGSGVREAPGKMIGAAAGVLPKFPGFGREKSDGGDEVAENAFPTADAAEEITEIPVVESPAEAATVASEAAAKEGRKLRIPRPSLPELRKPKLPNIRFGRGRSSNAADAAAAAPPSPAPDVALAAPPTAPTAPAIQPPVLTDDQAAPAPPPGAPETAAAPKKKQKISVPAPAKPVEPKRGPVNRVVKRIW